MTAFIVAARHYSGGGRKDVDKVLNDRCYRPHQPVKHRKDSKHRDTGTARALRTEHLYARAGAWAHHTHTPHRSPTVRINPDVPDWEDPADDTTRAQGSGFACSFVLVLLLLFPVVYFGSHLVGWWLR